jgi:hypothetical protein
MYDTITLPMWNHLHVSREIFGNKTYLALDDTIQTSTASLHNRQELLLAYLLECKMKFFPTI